MIKGQRKKFVQEYLKTFNATQAAIKAGYSKKTARSQGQRLLTNVDIKDYIKTVTSKIEKINIMSIQEIQELYTKIARGELNEDVVINVGNVLVHSEKEIAFRDRIRALDSLSKINGLFVEKVMNIDPPKIIDDI